MMVGGMYIHIPFCRQACTYCNFHFSTLLKYKEPLLAALIKEFSLRRDEVNYPLKTLYFGGGTPSVLDTHDWEAIFETLRNYYDLSELTEVTIEANPEDITKEKLAILRDHGVNRCSLGVQSFLDDDLKWMRRTHNVAAVDKAITLLKHEGFDNISIDLIYGLPNSTAESWQINLDKALSYHIPHISSYALTCEPKTLYQHQVAKKVISMAPEEATVMQFYQMIDFLQSQGYRQYEISNFAIPEWESKHNSSYWKSMPYIGFGPSAHSYKDNVRSWNIANNHFYIQSLGDNLLPSQSEILTKVDMYNEVIMVGMRMAEGVCIDKITSLGFVDHFLNGIQKHIENGNVLQFDNDYALSRDGKIFADRIASDLFYID